MGLKEFAQPGDTAAVRNSLPGQRYPGSISVTRFNEALWTPYQVPMLRTRLFVSKNRVARRCTAVAAALVAVVLATTTAWAAGWSQQQKLTASDGASGDLFGRASVSLSGDGTTALVGAPNKNSNTGATYVFSRSGS